MHEAMILLGYIYIVLIFGGIIANLFIMAYIWINEYKGSNRIIYAININDIINKWLI